MRIYITIRRNDTCYDHYLYATLSNNFYPLFSFIFVGIRKSNFQTHSYYNKTIYPLLLGINCIVQFSWNFFFAKFHFLIAIKCLKEKNFQGKRVLLKQGKLLERWMDDGIYVVENVFKHEIFCIMFLFQLL